LQATACIVIDMASFRVLFLGLNTLANDDIVCGVIAKQPKNEMSRAVSSVSNICTQRAVSNIVVPVEEVEPWQDIVGHLAEIV
jgi:hypothetical protein